MPAWTTGLVDHGAVLHGTALPPAVQAYAAARRGPRAETLGACCVTERDLPHLRSDAVPLHLVPTGGAGALEAALRWWADQPAGRVTLRRVSLRLRGDGSELAHNARRLVTVLDSVHVADDVEVHAAPPPPDGLPSAGWLAALDELAAREVGLLLPAAAPWTAAAVDAALDREQPLAFEASSAPEVRAAMTAVRTVLDGAPPADDWLVADPDAAARTRRWCRAVLVPDAPAVAAALA